MEATDKQPKVSHTLSYDIAESAVVFRMAWFVVASQPGILLSEYSEAESQIFKGKAMFATKIGDSKVTVRVWVEEAQKSVELAVFGGTETAMKGYLDGLVKQLESSLHKYRSLNEKDKSKLGRALVAKTCWDKTILEILSKAPLSGIYFDISLGREMIIKATEGEEVHPIALTTSAWLSKIESLPRDKPPPAEIATELAKKTIEWKKETRAVITRYL